MKLLDRLFTTVFLISLIRAVNDSVTFWVYLADALVSATVIITTAVPRSRIIFIIGELRGRAHSFNKMSRSGRDTRDSGGDLDCWCRIGVAQNPVAEFGDAGIDPRLVDLCASHTPAHHAR